MEPLPPPTPRRRVLFLKTSTKPLSLMDPSYTLLLETLHKKGLEVEERIWYPSPESLTPKDLTTAYQSITFLACWDYNLHITEFHKFLDEVITPIQKSDTIFVDTTGGDSGGEIPGYQDVILNHRGAMGSHGVVIKPSVSASAKETHRVPDLNSGEYDPLKAQANWAQVYEYARSLSSSVRVMIQAFEPAIKNGEYSIIFLGGEYSHTILKRPVETDFRAIEEYGARIGELESSKVPEEGKEIGRRVIEYVRRRFGYGEDWKLGYLRLDGVGRDDGTFVVIEAEMLEPYVYLHVEGAKEGLERFCGVLGGLN